MWLKVPGPRADQCLCSGQQTGPPWCSCPHLPRPPDLPRCLGDPSWNGSGSGRLGLVDWRVLQGCAKMLEARGALSLPAKVALDVGLRRSGVRKRLVVRSWLSQSQRPRRLRSCRLQAGAPGEPGAACGSGTREPGKPGNQGHRPLSETEVLISASSSLVLSFGGLDNAHSHWGGPPALLSPLSLMRSSCGHILTDYPETMTSQTARPPWLSPGGP